MQRVKAPHREPPKHARREIADIQKDLIEAKAAYDKAFAKDRQAFNDYQYRDVPEKFNAFVAAKNATLAALDKVKALETELKECTDSDDPAEKRARLKPEHDRVKELYTKAMEKVSEWNAKAREEEKEASKAREVYQRLAQAAEQARKAEMNATVAAQQIKTSNKAILDAYCDALTVKCKKGDPCPGCGGKSFSMDKLTCKRKCVFHYAHGYASWDAELQLHKGTKEECEFMH